MGRYDRFDRPPLPSWRRRWEQAHPLWGPLGCLFAVLLLALGYAVAVLVLQMDAVRRWVATSPGLLVQGRDPWLLAKGLFTLIFGLGFYALFSLIYAALVRAFGATPDAPWDLRAPVRRPRRGLVRELRALAPILGLGMAWWSVSWVQDQPWYRPIPALQIPGPVPDLFFYVLAFGIWYYAFQVFFDLLNALLLTLLKTGTTPTSSDEEDEL